MQKWNKMIFSLISCLKIKIFNIDVNLVTCDLLNLYSICHAWVTQWIGDLKLNLVSTVNPK